MTDWWQAAPLAAPEQQQQYATGEAYLKTVPPDMAGIVKGLTAYKVNPNSLSIKGGHRERMIGGAMRYDDSYDQAAYPARAAAIKEFNAGGVSSPAGQITAGRTAIAHLHDVSDAAEAMKQVPGLMQKIGASGLPILSYAAASLQNRLVRGTPEGVALKQFLDASNHYSEEVTKFYAGSGGSEAERARSLSTLDPNLSIEELRGVLKYEANLMHGKINQLQDRFKTAMGPKAWLTAHDEAGPQFPIITKKAEEALKTIYERAAPKAKAQAAVAPPTGTAAQIPAPAIEMLKASPQTAAKFNEIFGAGEAEKILGAGP